MSVSVEVSIAEDLVAGHVAESGVDETPGSGDDDVPEPGLLQTWAAAAYLEDTPAIASLRVTTADEVQQLNKEYRHKDKATNVLSFPMMSPPDVDLCLLGDIILCAPVINHEAEQQGKTAQQHWAHMVVHGMLHLQGYDHIENNEAEQMEQLEIKILGQLGFPNPYQSTAA